MMKRRWILYALLSGLLSGCATAPAPVKEEPVEESVKQPVKETVTQEGEETNKKVERNTVMILMKTSKGDIKLELDKEKAPKTVANFLAYVEAGHYSDTIFHRVMDGFMIQGGGFDVKMSQKPAANTVENEAANGLKNVVGSIAMARTADPHSAGAQFFINVNDNAFLDYPGQDGWGYCVFGKVVEGMDVVDAIKGVPTRNMGGAFANAPVEQVTINEIVVVDG